MDLLVLSVLIFRCGGGESSGCCSQNTPDSTRRKLPSAPFTDSLSGAGELLQRWAVIL